MKVNKKHAFFSARHQDNPLKDSLVHSVLLNRTLSSADVGSATITQADKHGIVHVYELACLYALRKAAAASAEGKHKCIVSFQTYVQGNQFYRIAVAKLRGINKAQDTQHASVQPTDKAQPTDGQGPNKQPITEQGTNKQGETT